MTSTNTSILTTTATFSLLIPDITIFDGFPFPHQVDPRTSQTFKRSRDQSPPIEVMDHYKWSYTLVNRAEMYESCKGELFSGKYEFFNVKSRL